MRHLLREPFPASLFAFLVCYAYLKFKSQLNREPNHKFIKPSFLVAVLIYFIVYLGNTNTEPLGI